MGCTPIVLILTVGITTVIALTGNSTTPTPNTTLDEPEPRTNGTSRRGRQFHVELIEIPGSKTKRQIIKIPGNVSKVKLVRPVVNPRPPFTRYQPWRPNAKKNQGDEPDERKVKRNFKKPRGKPQEFGEDEAGPKPRRKHVLGDYLAKYETQTGPEEESPGLLYGDLPASTSIHMKQVSPPKLFPLELGKHSHLGEKFKFHDENFIPGLSIKKLPTKGRQFQSIFTQQYTTHNPHVTANLGLGGLLPKGSFLDASSYAFDATYNQPAGVASNHVVSSLPLLTPGIHLIQAPQFRDVTVNQPVRPSRLTSFAGQQRQEEGPGQRATIRDILDADCPAHDAKGYCESPPRYPMQQIGNIVKKCAGFMELMNTQPLDEPHDVYTGFGKRTDNTSQSSDPKNSSSLSRSGTNVSACPSDLSLTEPGYAKEVISGRWFVIVQHPDTTIQRIATDTCRSPGKFCGGLSGLKCAKAKSTRCVQRFTYQRLISWDPETPDGCPRVRSFRFPSACVCHVIQ